MTEAPLDSIRDVIQEDVNKRGLATVPSDNLLTACAGDFHAACRSIAENPNASVAVVTGFFIPHATPPCGETDGPLGAVFLARALVPLGIGVTLLTDAFCHQALEAGLDACGLSGQVNVMSLASSGVAVATLLPPDFPLTHLIALERVGPSHSAESLQAQLGGTGTQTYQRFLHEVRPEHRDRCHTMRGLDITAQMAPAHLLFEAVQGRGVTTIGIGDGGNEIGMGKVPWDVIRRNIPNGGLVACRVPADYLIVCGVSNWGAYGLAAGVRLLRGQSLGADLADVERERALLQVMVERGPLVDGVTGRQTATVDGLAFERYIEPLRRIVELC